MRTLEIIIFILLFIIVLLTIMRSFGKMRFMKYLSYLTFIVFIFHWTFEGIRWQLYPLYLIIIFIFMISVMELIGIIKTDILKRNREIIKIITTMMCVALSISFIAALAFPVYKIPNPEGQNNIGTISFEVDDNIRKEIYGTENDKNRRIKMQVWYPAEDVEGYKHAPWLVDGVAVAKGVSRKMGFPEFVFRHTALIESNSYLLAPISMSQEKYPVVIMSHGWTGFRNLHTDVAEALASNGYIVIGIEHTYGSLATVFDNGEVAYVDENALPDREETSNFLEYANKLVNTYAGDIELAIQQMDKLNVGKINTMFKDRLDTSRLGLIGHSTGGGAAVRTALKNNRVKVVIGLDSWVEPIKKEVIDKGLDIPGLFLRSEGWEKSLNNENLLYIFDRSRSGIYAYQVNGTKHLDFTMSYMYSPLSKYFGITGSLDGWKGASLQKDFIKSFFDKYLKDNEILIENLLDKYDNVKEFHVKDSNEN